LARCCSRLLTGRSGHTSSAMEDRTSHVLGGFSAMERLIVWKPGTRRCVAGELYARRGPAMAALTRPQLLLAAPVGAIWLSLMRREGRWWHWFRAFLKGISLLRAGWFHARCDHLPATRSTGRTQHAEHCHMGLARFVNSMRTLANFAPQWVCHFHLPSVWCIHDDGFALQSYMLLLLSER